MGSRREIRAQTARLPGRWRLPRLDLRQVEPPRLALIMAGELLKPAAGMLILSGDRSGPAFLGLLVEESNVVHGP